MNYILSVAIPVPAITLDNSLTPFLHTCVPIERGAEAQKYNYYFINGASM
jgi:hypothetical protein